MKVDKLAARSGGRCEVRGDRRLDLRLDIRPRPLCLALANALALAFAPSVARSQSLPTLPSVVHGVATVTRPALGQMSVQQGSQQVVINWQSFSIGANGRVTFNQPNAQSVALNRVVGVDPSVVMGTLAANGRVFLVNPNGVLFGAGSSVNVGGLVASTLNLDDNDFLAGRYAFTRGAAARAGVVNEGRLEARPGGVIALIGSTVEQRGSISTPGGTTALAAGRTVTLDFQGDGLTQLRVTEGDLHALASNTGALVAEGGRVLMLADTTQAKGLVVNQGGVVRARSLTPGPGGVVIAGGAGDVSITGSVDTRGGSGQRGGDVSVSGRNVGLLGTGHIDASGGSSGAHVELVATKAGEGGKGREGGIVVVGSNASISADATALGNGGRVDLTGASVRLHGSISARGADRGGNGGLVKLTATEGVDTAGMRVDASAVKGSPGTLDIDPWDVTIRSGFSEVPYDLDPFVPTSTSTSTVYTGDINNVLNRGSNVTITTGTTGPEGSGTITLGYGSSDHTVILRSTGSAPVVLSLQAANGIVANYSPGFADFSIVSTAGPLNVDMSGNAAGRSGNGVSLPGVTIKTNGGRLNIFGGDATRAASSTTGSGVWLDQATVDTRVNASDASPGGNVLIRGESRSPDSWAGVDIVGSTIQTSTGALQITGSVAVGAIGDGMRVRDSILQATTGNLVLTGLGRAGVRVNLDAPGSVGVPVSAIGLHLANAEVSSATGTIDIRGGVQADGSDAAAAASVGVYMQNFASDFARGGGSFVRSAAAVSVAGSVAGNGVGVLVDQDSIYSPVQGNIAGSNVTIRAGNNTAYRSDALQLDGTIKASGIANIRAGGVDTAGNLVERDDVPLTLGNGSYPGLTIGSNELNRISAATVVLGSDRYANAITVDAFGSGSGSGSSNGSSNFISNSNLTLHSGSGLGSIGIGAPLGVVTGKTLALVTGGAITQTANAPLTADNLLIRANSATLLNTGNSVGVLAATVGTGGLDFLSNRALTLGRVDATGAAAATDTPLALAATSLTGGTMRVRTSNGAMTLDGNIVANTLDLVTPAVFINSSNSTITASDRWHLWAQGWIGEIRGGLAGNGTLANVYGCAYGSDACSALPVATANTFIYADRPVLSLSIDNQTRRYGDSNPLFSVATGGLVNGDTAANIVGGTPSTSATVTSNAGQYVISGEALFANAGYVLGEVNNGTLAVTRRPLQISIGSQARVYGDANPVFTSTPTGLVNADTAPMRLSTTATPQSNIGNYAITGFTTNTALFTNYSITQTDGTLTVNPRSLTITANNASRVYGDANPAFTGTAAGLAPFDTPASVGLGFSSVGATAAVGNYPIDPALANPTAASNYAATAAPGVLAVNKATLTFVADPKTRTIFESAPQLTGTVSGFRNGESVGSATTGVPGWSSPATPASAPGLYAVNGSGLSALNYVFVQAPGNVFALNVTGPSVREQILGVQFADQGVGSVEARRIEQSTYVYDRNLGRPQMCVPDNLLTAQGVEPNGSRDLLSVEWSRLRWRPNVTNCFSSGRQGGCNDF